MSILKKLSMAASVGAALVAVGMLSAVEARATTITGGGYTATDDINNDGIVDPEADPNPDYLFLDHNISSSGTSVLSGASNDDASVTQNLGFSFQFYDNTYTQVSFSSNGLITFGGSNNSGTDVNLGTTAPTPNLPTIAALWDDWKTDTGEVLYQTLGTTGNQRFVIQWKNVRGSGLPENPMVFQAVLFEGSNEILLSYEDLDTRPNAKDNGGQATVGIRDADGRNLLWSNNPGSSSGLIFQGQSIRFSKTQAVPFEFSPGLSILALGALFGAERLKNKLPKRKFSQSEFTSN